MKNNTLDERSWLRTLESCFYSFMSWQKRDQKGIYREKYESFTEYFKVTRLFIFNDSIMNKVAPSPIFTDGINVFISEISANECWREDNSDLKYFKPVWHGIMKSLDISLKVQNKEAPWAYVDYIEPKDLCQKLKVNKGEEWIKVLGIKQDEDYEALKKHREDVVLYIKEFLALTKEAEKNREDSKDDEKPRTAIPVIMNRKPPFTFEAEKLVNTRWDDCVAIWEEPKDSELTYYAWNTRWVLCEKIGSLMGMARNLMVLGEDETSIMKEGWNVALMGWVRMLSAMLNSGDWLSFGRTIIAFLKKCQEQEALQFKEKAGIVGVATAVFEDQSFKTSLIDVLSGGNEFWHFSKFIDDNINRFWIVNQKNKCEIHEMLAYYSLLPDITTIKRENGVRRQYIVNAFRNILERAGMEYDVDNINEVIDESLKVLVDSIRVIEQDDAITLVGNWKDWLEDQLPDLFSNDEENESKSRKKDKEMQKLKKVTDILLKTKRWKLNQKQQIENLFNDL